MHFPVGAKCPFTSTGLHTTALLFALKLNSHNATNAMILSAGCSTSLVLNEAVGWSQQHQLKDRNSFFTDSYFFCK